MHSSKTKITVSPSRQKPISRDSICKTALALFKKKGVDETSVNDIVEKAGIAKGTFYLYFKNRDDLINAVFDPFRVRFIGEVVLKNSDTPRVVSFAESIIGFFSANRLFLGELRKNMDRGRELAYVSQTVDAFSRVILNYLNLNENYPIRQLDSYSRMIIRMVLEICHGLIVEGSIRDENEAKIMLQDFLKRFFDCERIFA
jgi:AcrR family transcriptional regulator